MSRAKITCRSMPEYHNPKCDWCYIKAACKGPVDRTPGAYNAYNCPTGGEHAQECLYCKDAAYCIRSRHKF